LRGSGRHWTTCSANPLEPPSLGQKPHPSPGATWSETFRTNMIVAGDLAEATKLALHVCGELANHPSQVRCTICGECGNEHRSQFPSRSDEAPASPDPPLTVLCRFNRTPRVILAEVDDRQHDVGSVHSGVEARIRRLTAWQRIAGAVAPLTSPEFAEALRAFCKDVVAAQ
jgi:hypothetical protein